MAVFDEEAALGLAVRRPLGAHDIGQALDTLSLSELEERIGLLRSEITRLENMARAKQASKMAADSFFKS